MKDKVLQSIGKRGVIVTGGLTVNVKILDYKTAYGKERWLVTPISGGGEVWMQRVDIITALKKV